MLNGHGGLAVPLANIPFGMPAERLAYGVQLFFIISGFVLARPFVQHFQQGRPRPSLGGYYMRRLTRLEPPYILSLVLYAVSWIVFRHAAAGAILQSASQSLFYVHNFFPALPPVNAPTWSLEVEVEFYLITPLLALVFAIPNAWARRGVLVAAAFAFVVIFRGPPAAFRLPQQMPFFLAGFLLADLDVLAQKARRIGWDIASAALWLSVPFLDENWTYGPVVIVLTLAFALSLRGRYMRALLSTRWIALLGGMCYSVYLIHMLVISALFPLTSRAMVFHGLAANYLTQVLLLLPAIWGASILYFVWIERPCMDPQWPRQAARFLSTAFTRRHPRTAD